MTRRRVLLVATWMVGTLLAMALVQLSVGVLTQRVWHQSLPAFDEEGVEEELERVTLAQAAERSSEDHESNRSPATVSPENSPADEHGPTSGGGDPTGAPGRVGPQNEAKDDPGDSIVTDGRPAVPGPSGVPAPTAVVAPSTVPGASVSVPTSGAPAVVPSTSTTGAPVPVVSVSPSVVLRSAGGFIVVQCTGDAVRLLSYTPAAGYDARVHEWGPDEVEVRFEAHELHSKVKGVCAGGTVTPEIEDE